MALISYGQIELAKWRGEAKKLGSELPDDGSAMMSPTAGAGAESTPLAPGALLVGGVPIGAGISLLHDGAIRSDACTRVPNAAAVLTDNRGADAPHR